MDWVYALEARKVADPVALAVVLRITVALYRETGRIEFLPDVYASGQVYASKLSVFTKPAYRCDGDRN